MGTRSTTHVFELNEPGDVTPALLKKAIYLTSIYRQFDGYPQGHGADVAEFASHFTIVNGFGPDMKMGKYANGAGCFAAQLIRRLKQSIGNIYITTKGDRQEYNYFLYVRAEERGFNRENPPSIEGLVYIVAKKGNKVLFSGRAKDYRTWLLNYVAEQKAENA